MPGAAAKTPRVRISTKESRLVKLGAVYADSLRLTIVTELFMREMSAREFFEVVGGSSYDSVRKHFAKLERYRWIRRVRQRVSGRGRPEWVYRTTEQALIDEETWAEIPLSMRDAFTLQLMQQLSERLGIALEGGTFGMAEQVFSVLSPVRVDEAGWQAGLRALGACLVALEQEQCDAKVRLAEHCVQPTLMIVALAGFESPGAEPPPARNALPTSALQLDIEIPWTIRLAKVFGDPTSLAIVRELNDAPLSPSGLWEQIGQSSKQSYDRRCKVLTELGWIAPIGEASGGPRRGAREVFYRATLPAVSLDHAWAIIPPNLRVGEGWETYRRLCELVFKSVRSGTFNRRVGRHLTWQPLLLDQLGCHRVTQTLNRCVADISALVHRGPRISDESRLINSTFFIGGFESPPLKGLPLWGEF